MNRYGTAGVNSAVGVPTDRPVAGARSTPAAFFDVDGTLVATHIVHQYLQVRRWLAQRHGSSIARLLHPLWQLGFVVGCARYAYLDRVSRSRMNIAFYRQYAGLPAQRVRDAADDCFRRVLRPHLFPLAANCVSEHLARDQRVVLVTGSVDFLVEPLRSYLAGSSTPASVDLLARTLVERDGVFTGELDGPPIGETEKAEQVRRYASRNQLELPECSAYGDSVADLPMLEAVGHPHVVNPDRRLRRVARQRGWPCHFWPIDHHGGSP